jgi:GntR family transcriptional regulator/MocR family aminotransferase
LLNLAARYNFAIIEDDYDYDFHYTSSPVVPMASLDHHGSVIYIGTLSKTLVPAVRIGFVIAPINFIKEAVTIRRFIDFQGDSMSEIAIAELYQSGIIQSHIKKMNKVYMERRDHLCKLLKDRVGRYVSFKVPDGGLGIWTKFVGVDLPRLSVLASKEGLLFYDGTIYNTKHSFNFTRLGFSSLTLQEQEKAVDILLRIIKNTTP